MTKSPFPPTSGAQMHHLPQPVVFGGVIARKNSHYSNRPIGSLGYKGQTEGKDESELRGGM